MNTEDSSRIELPRDDMTQANRDLGNQGLPGSVFYSAIWLLIIVSTPVAQDWAYLSWTVFVLLTVAGLLRLILGIRFEDLYFRSPAGWLASYYGAVISQAIVWGGTTAFLLWQYVTDWPAYLSGFSTAGIVAGGTISLSTHLRLQRSYIVIILLPGIIACWLVPHPTAYALGILFLLAIGFLFAIGRKLNRSYWTSLENNRLLTRRAEQLAEAKIKAESADRAKSQFVANISHELRTPLNGVIGTIELLRHNTSAELQTKYLDVMAKSAQVLLHRISEILDFSKIGAGKLELDAIAMDPVRTAQEATSLMRDAAESKGLVLEVDIADDLPHSVIGDPYRLNQILLNLLSNAIKFTERGRITVTLEQLQRFTDAVILRFTVSDTGIGIPQKAQKRIFESFVQAEGSSTRQYGGTGLGLSVSSELVKLMGGDLRVHSQVGVGSRFSFIVTFEIPREVMTSQPEVNDTEENDAPPPLRLNVLLAEDNQMNQFVAQEMLSMLQCKTHCANNGQAAIDQFEKGGIDVILMDCEMPEMDGFEATKRIRKIESIEQLEPIPIVALTAHVAREDRERTASVGMNGFLSKPFTVDGLYKVLLEVTEESNRASKL